MTGKPSPLADARPLFLIGPPRSGTTLMTRILNAHPEILMTNETAVFIQLGELIEKSARGIEAGISYGKEYNNLWSQKLRENGPDLIFSYYEDIAKEQGKAGLSFWGEKHPHMSQCLDVLSSFYPEATYVYALRDPRDSACSIAEMNSVPVGDALDTWKTFSDAYERFVEHQDPQRVIEVKYEDLIHDYIGVSESVFERLGLNFHQNVQDFLVKYSSRDSHSFKAKRWTKKIDFVSKSFRRWERDMTEAEQIHARGLAGEFLEKRGYEKAGVALAGSMRSIAVVDSRASEFEAGHFVFHCNICGRENEAISDELDREKSSCASCGSSVRTRSIVALLSQELFGESLKIAEFPVAPKIRGIDLSGWPGYARRLPHKLSYINTFFHKEPFFDVTRPEEYGYGNLDFMISSEVFEHVPQPVSRALEGACSVLRPGAPLILTVPYEAESLETVEHFPPLEDYWIEEEANGNHVLLNRNPDGSVERFPDVRFHGGPGQTAEMRVFAQDDLLQALKAAGFSSVEIRDESIPAHGIFWNARPSRPIVATR